MYGRASGFTLQSRHSRIDENEDSHHYMKTLTGEPSEENKKAHCGETSRPFGLRKAVHASIYDKKKKENKKIK